MNIAFLTPEYVTESNFDGGLANYLYRVAQGMRQRGHQVEIFTISDRNETFEHNSILVHRVYLRNKWLKIFKKITLNQFNNILEILVGSFLINRKLSHRHKKKKFNIVQSSSYRAPGLFTSGKGHIPVVTRISSYEPLYRRASGIKSSLDLRLAEFLEIKLMRQSDAVYAPSKLISKIIGKLEQIDVDVLEPPFKLEIGNYDGTIYNENLKGIKYLLFFGTLCEQKGIKVIGSILSDLFKIWPYLHFVFVGKEGGLSTGSAIPYIYNCAADFKNNIHYLDVLRHEQLYPIIKNAHAVVLPSLIDNLPNTCLESMALGKIVIGTRGASFDQLIQDGYSGFLVDINNPNQLLTAITKVLNLNDSEKKNIEDHAKKRVELLGNDCVIEELEKYFAKIMLINSERRNVYEG